MDIQKILIDHAKWTTGDPEGVRADLSGAYLSCAKLHGVNLSGADLSGAAGLPQDESDRVLLRRAVHEQISIHPETHDQSNWHSSCGTTHCVAGWAVVKSGALGRYLEQQLGIQTAAHLLLGGKTRPSFDGDAKREDILRDLLAGIENETTNPVT